MIFHRTFTTNQPINFTSYRKYYFSLEVLKPLAFLPRDLYALCYRNYHKREEFVWRVVKDMEAYLGRPISPISPQEVEARGADGEVFDMYLPTGEQTDLRTVQNKVRIMQNRYDTKHRTFTGFYNEYYVTYHSDNLRRACGECYVEAGPNNEYSLGAVVDGLERGRCERLRPGLNKSGQYDPQTSYELHAPRKYVPRTKIEIECYDRLMSFLRHKIYSYNTVRNKIESTGTSQLAPYCALGVIPFEHLISIVRTVLETRFVPQSHHSLDAHYSRTLQPQPPQPLGDHVPESCKEFDRQCHWLLYSKLKAPRDIGIPPPLSPEQCERFVQWTDGNLPEGTAVDQMVNVQMRRLKDGCVMSNRFRLMVTNYLVKRLGIDWRYGEFYFEAALIDSHPEINRKNWDGQMRSRFFNCYNLDTQLAQYGR